MAKWEIVEADVMEWAKAYTGQKFHAAIMDPPYHLGPKGFMNRGWDAGEYGISFRPETWAALAEHLLPGAWIFAFASSRGWHRMAVAMEDAGLILQPSIFVNGEVLELPLAFLHVEGQSFPKATRIDIKLDQNAGVTGNRSRKVYGDGNQYYPTPDRTNPNPMDWETKAQDRFTEYNAVTDLAQAWQGHRYGGQVLKNAATTVVLAYKPLPGQVRPIICAQKLWTTPRLDCIVETGAGALWVDGGRIGTEFVATTGRSDEKHAKSQSLGDSWSGVVDETPHQGRWPANFCLLHSPGCIRVGTKRVKGSGRLSDNPSPGGYDVGFGGSRDNNKYADADGLEEVEEWRCVEGCAVKALGEQSGQRLSGYRVNPSTNKTTWFGANDGSYIEGERGYSDSGSCTRFYHNADWSYEIAERLAMVNPVLYMAKAGRGERDAGLEEFDLKAVNPNYGKGGFKRPTDEPKREIAPFRNPHPTVKPIALIRWLATLLLPPKSYAPCCVLVPFAGVASEGIGCMLAGWEEIIMIEQESEYVEIGKARMSWWQERYDRGLHDVKEILKSNKKKKDIPNQIRLKGL